MNRMKYLAILLVLLSFTTYVSCALPEIVDIFPRKSSRPPRTCTFAGFPCCLKYVSSPAYDSNGYGYGFEKSQSCILASQCICGSSLELLKSKPSVSIQPSVTLSTQKSAILPIFKSTKTPSVTKISIGSSSIKPIQTSTSRSSLIRTSSQVTPTPTSKFEACPSPSPTIAICKSRGEQCCVYPVSVPTFDGAGYGYGIENFVKCIICNECKALVFLGMVSTTTTTRVSSPRPTESCSFYGFACCVNPVTNPASDVNGNLYGTENGKSCIIPPGCTTCIAPNPAATSVLPPAVTTTTTTRASSPRPTESCSFYGFACCVNPVTNPASDVNGNLYGTENGKSCIIPPGCTTCIAPNPAATSVLPPAVTTTTTTRASSPRPTESCSFYGFACCVNPVTNPASDVNGNLYGTENGKSCIIPPGCTTCIASPPKGSTSMDTLQNYITRSGNVLYNGDQPYRFVSLNTPSLLMLEDRPSSNYMWIPPTPWEQMDAMKTIAGFHGRVTRSYTLGFGYQQHVTAARTYYEPAFVAFDNALAAARLNGVRLIIPLINNHNGNDASTNFYYGDYGLFTRFRSKPPSQFFTDSQLISDFQDLISYLLNRVNTVNGIAYKDDSTILAIQFGNELGSWSDPPPPASWSILIAKYIKSIAPNVLVMDGTIGGVNRIPKEVLQSPFIDIFTNHYYGGPASPSADSSVVASYGKAFIVGEYGLINNDWYNAFMRSTVNTPTVSGCLIWSLRYHSFEGGFYAHSEGNGYFAYHAPGFPQAPGFSGEEATLVPMIRSYALSIQGLDQNTPYPTPDTPVPASGNVTPLALRWGGSAWAKGYNIQRQRVGTDVWTQIASNVPDNVIGPSTIYSDSSATRGVAYNYRIQAVGVSGVASDWLQIGPLAA